MREFKVVVLGSGGVGESNLVKTQSIIIKAKSSPERVGGRLNELKVDCICHHSSRCDIVNTRLALILQQ